MLLSLIVAMDRERAIGRNNALPWHLSADLRYFKRVTMGKPILMGRRTFEAIGKPLPGRQNLVITRNRAWRADGCAVCPSIEAALAQIDDVPEAFVIGGGQIFAATLDRCQRMHVTHVDAVVNGDVFFPDVDWSGWQMCEVERHGVDEQNTYPFRIAVYLRK